MEQETLTASLTQAKLNRKRAFSLVHALCDLESVVSVNRRLEKSYRDVMSSGAMDYQDMASFRRAEGLALRNVRAEKIVSESVLDASTSGLTIPYPFAAEGLYL